MSETIRTNCASLRQTINNALTAVTNIERANTETTPCCQGKSAGKLTTAQRITNLKEFRKLISALEPKHAIDFTFTNVDTGKKVSYRLYATDDNVECITARINETIVDLVG